MLSRAPQILPTDRLPFAGTMLLRTTTEVVFFGSEGYFRRPCVIARTLLRESRKRSRCKDALGGDLVVELHHVQDDLPMSRWTCLMSASPVTCTSSGTHADDRPTRVNPPTHHTPPGPLDGVEAAQLV